MPASGQKVTALRVASVPEREFERQVESEQPPTAAFLLAVLHGMAVQAKARRGRTSSKQ